MEAAFVIVWDNLETSCDLAFNGTGSPISTKLSLFCSSFFKVSLRITYSRLFFVLE